MCRFTAYAGEPMNLRPLVYEGSHPLYRQSWAPRELIMGTVNADGYGVGWYEADRPVRIRRARPVWHDPDLERLLESIRAPVAVALLRNATPGLPVTESQVAPLVVDRWTFGLNGYLTDYRSSVMAALYRLLDDDLLAELQGVSDTEGLFLLALAHLREGATPGEALLATRTQALELAGAAGVEAQLNMILTGPDQVAVTRTSSTDQANSLYVAVRPGMAPQGVMVASEALDDDEAWEAVPLHSLVVARRDGSLEISPAD